MNSRDNDTRSSRIIRVTYVNNLHKLEWRRIKRLRSRRNVYFVFKRNSVSSIEFRKNSVFQTYVDSNTPFFSNPFGWYFDNRQNVDPSRLVSCRTLIGWNSIPSWLLSTFYFSRQGYCSHGCLRNETKFDGKWEQHLWFYDFVKSLNVALERGKNERSCY